jgi:GNAT superfamily N-acetyltransferase
VKVSKQFVELDKKCHDRISFDCGEEELNDFIKTKAAKHATAGINKTFVLAGADLLSSGRYPIAAYFTIAASSIESDSLPVDQARRLPHYPIPVFLIAQLAVHSKCKGQGLGKATLVVALKTLHKISLEMPAYAVVIDCLNDDAKSFYEKFDFELLETVNGRTRLFLPMMTVSTLF